jgi:hypothetical protein
MAAAEVSVGNPAANKLAVPQRSVSKVGAEQVTLVRR